MNLCNISNVKRLLSEFNTGTKKGFGQNFLINEEIPYKIAEESYLCHTKKAGEGKSGVIEIGPGIGTLTCKLCERYDKVVAVEIDKTLIPVLDKTLSDYNNKEIINEDFLKLDLEKLVSEKFGGAAVSVCANLPYYITTPIIMKILEESFSKKVRFLSVTVMVQKEVAERLCASAGDSEYGAITASLNYYGKARKLFDVSPDNFMPSPKVTSSVIQIEPHEQIPYKVSSEKMLFEVIAGAFAQRRKTLVNSLSSYFKTVSKEEISNIITSLGYDINIRGEKLGTEDFCRIADEFIKKGINI